MRLTRFLIEARRMPSGIERDKNRYESDYDELAQDKASEVGKLIRENCKKFLKESQGKVMWRGVRHDVDGWTEKTIRTNRYPKDTPQEISDQLDDSFEAAFGWKARSSGLFCTGSKDTAGGYGDAFSVWPIGDFKFLWSGEVEDLYTYIDEGGIFSSDFDSYDFEEEWLQEYGEGEQGQWSWNGEGTGYSDKDEATEYIVKDKLKPEWEKENKEAIKWFEKWDEADENKKDDIESEFYDTNIKGSITDYDPDEIENELFREAGNGDWEWEPEMELDNFVEMRREEAEQNALEQADNVISTYTDKNLDKGIDSHNEIMIGPGDNHYYLVDRAITPWVWEYAQGILGTDDAKQMKFEFVFKPNPKVDKGVYQGNRFFAGVYNFRTDSIEYIITYRDLVVKRGWDRDQESEWDDPNRIRDIDVSKITKWLPERVYKRWRSGQSIIFFIPSNLKPPITPKKFDDMVKIVRMYGSESISYWTFLKNHIKIKK